MHHRLLVFRLVIGEGAAAMLLERLAETRDVAVAKDAPHAVDQPMLHTVAANILLLEKPHERGSHVERDGVFHGALRRKAVNRSPKCNRYHQIQSNAILPKATHCHATRSITGLH